MGKGAGKGGDDTELRQRSGPAVEAAKAGAGGGGGSRHQARAADRGVALARAGAPYRRCTALTLGRHLCSFRLLTSTPTNSSKNGGRHELLGLRPCAMRS